jgi:YidC/Oxa1 family membrane protein insertase
MIIANVIEDAFSPLIRAFEAVMVFIHDNIVGGSWGLAIIGLTVVIRAVLVPLTFRQLKSMQEMQRLAPQIQALKEKYKEDKQRQQQEIMKFYQENKINPLASCLPLLLQIPVFISLFYMLRTDLKKHICGNELVAHYNALHHTTFEKVGQLAGSDAGRKFISATSCKAVAPHSAKFLFLPDITDKATGVALAVLIVLYVGSQLASTLLMSTTTDRTQRMIFLALPFFFVVFVINFPAGLLVYWITTNCWTIVQQMIVRKRLGPLRPPDAEPAPGLGDLFRQARGQAATEPASPRAKDRTLVTPAGGAAKPKARPTAPPPAPPRKKKKRSGRRR